MSALMMKPSEIKEMSAADRDQKLLELRQELFNLRFQAASGQMEKPHRVREIRRDIARLLTFMREDKS